MSNYNDIDFAKVKGYNKLSDQAKVLFVETYRTHNSGQGLEYKEDWEPIKVKEHLSYLEVHFKNGEWLHYYINGTWG